MRPRQRAERQNKDCEKGAGRQRIAEQRERAVSARELRRHDPRADDAREQERGAQELRRDAPHVGSTATSTRPISRSLFCSVSLSRERRGNEVKMPMR